MKRYSKRILALLLSLAVILSMSSLLVLAKDGDYSGILTVNNDDGSTVELTGDQITGATSIEANADNQVGYGGTRYYGTLYKLGSILEENNIDISEAHIVALKADPSDGYANGVLNEELDNYYIYDQGSVLKGNTDGAGDTYAGASGTYGSAYAGTSGKGWQFGKNITTIEVTKDHVWQFTKGSCTHQCACEEKETSSLVTAEVPATCSDAGKTAVYKYDSCGTEFGGDEIPALGHSLTRVDAKEATTEAEGNIEYWTCSVCGKFFSDAEGKTEITKDKTIVPKKEESKPADTTPADTTPADTTPAVDAGDTVNDNNNNTYEVTSVKSNTVAFTKAKNVKSVTVPATIEVNGVTYKVTTVNANAFTSKKIRIVTIGKNVKQIKANAFKGSKATKVIIKTKSLTKAKVKNSLKGSKVKTVQVRITAKASKTNKTYVKKYKKYFTKANAGKKVTVK